MATLTTPHEQALTLLFAELEQTAAAQRDAFLGTPGSLARRTNDNGTEYWVHRYLDGVGRRKETYLGTVDDAGVTAHVDALREKIAVADATIARVRVLVRSGFANVDRKAYSTVASLHNHGLFRAGALLIGSHAFGALLNALGVRAVAYATEDVDIARPEQLALSGVPPFLGMLRETGIEFFEVPALNRRAPSTSYAERGGSRLKVDLLVPSSDESYRTIPVPELKAHATGLPYLRYLLGSSQEVPLLSPHGVVMVRVPVPERFAVHKLLVSQLRAGTTTKAAKDLRQAATLIEPIVERFPGALEDAMEALPKSATRHIRRAVAALESHLPANAEAAWDVLRSTKGRQAARR
ncbi:MAG TPA: GSU2403 family nucleotidyltransferase fold protein [Steroidobacteraceae bacterium]|nr:GSU2403 family nucleotidyltransferase fold protein [Steroidobacteraceae bacterium]